MSVRPRVIDCAAAIQEHLVCNRDEQAQELLDALVAAGIDRQTIAEQTHQLSRAWNAADSPSAMWRLVEDCYLVDGRERGYVQDSIEAFSLEELRGREAEFYRTSSRWPLG